MRRPNNFESKYLPAAEAARRLRLLADHIEKSSDFAHWNISVSIWKKEWENLNFEGGCVTQGSFLSGKNNKGEK